MARPPREPAPDVPDPLDALAAAADALHSADDGDGALDALRRAEEAIHRIARAPDREAELARVSSDIARARARLAAGLVSELRETANRLYESAILLLEPTRPTTATHAMLLRLLLRRALAASEQGRHADAERAMLFARGAARALALGAGDSPSPPHGALERLVRDGHVAAQSRTGALACEAMERALRALETIDADLAVPRVVVSTLGDASFPSAS